MEDLQIKLESAALRYDPFAGDFASPGTRTFKDKIVTLRKERECSNCGRKAKEESRCRSRTDRFEGKMEEYTWCSDCTLAMGIAVLDEGRVFEILGRIRTGQL